MPGGSQIHTTIEETALETGASGSKKQTPSIGPSVWSYLVATGDIVPPWWSRRRDIELHRLVKESNHLSGIAYLATTKLVNIPLTFVAKDPTITAHVDFAQAFTEQLTLASEFGQTIRETLKRFIYDYLIADNGGFMEILGGGDPGGALVGAPVALRHLDSHACTRTGDPLYPVYYEDSDGVRPRRYKLHYSRVLFMAQQPSGLQRMNGVGFSSASRSFMLAQVLNDQIIYKLEKMGSRPAEKLIVGNNVETEQLYQAYMMAEQINSNLGFRRFGRHVFIGGENVQVQDVELNQLTPFDEETGTNMAMYALFFTWGMDVRDGWPISGSKSSDQIALLKARGRLPSDFTKDLALQMNLKVCPTYLKTVMDFQDDEEDMQRANIQDIRSRRLNRLQEGGIVDSETQRRIMVMDGDLPREEFVRQQLADGKLEDGMPVASLFFKQDPLIQTLLTLDGIPDPTVFDDNDKEVVLREIQVNKTYCYQVMGEERSEPKRRRAAQALAALDWLEGQYMKPPPGQFDPDEEEPDEPEAPMSRQREEDRLADEQEEDDDAEEDTQPGTSGENRQPKGIKAVWLS